MQLVSNWKKAWRWFSMQAMVIAGAVQGTWIALPDDLRSSVPIEWVSSATLGLMVLGAVGRLVSQDK